MLHPRTCWTFFALLAAYGHISCSVTVPPWESEDASFWNTKAQGELDQAMRAKQNENRAKNIILFIGDGMGMPTITAGLFAYTHMEYEIMRDKGPDGQPSLTEMTDKAIRILKRNPNGFFLLVESGHMYNAHQDNLAVRALHEMVEFDNAIKKSLDMVEEKNSLIVVTADNSMGFTLGGSPTRGNPIFGVVDKDTHILDNKPMTTLGYLNGPGMDAYSFMRDGRQDLTNITTSDPDYVFQAGIPTEGGTRGGEDVVIYARGPMSHLFNGVHEQNYVYHVMAYAACLGKDKDKYCTQTPDPTPGAATFHMFSHWCMVMGLLFTMKCIVFVI